jgi:DNA-binding transcriptional ArsR family regulator
MDILKVNAALSNNVRLDIMKWLKEPAANFPPHVEVEGFDDGVCVKNIQLKTGLSQSTISHYLSVLQEAGLVIPTRHGKWTYYRRDEKNIKSYLTQIALEL